MPTNSPSDAAARPEAGFSLAVVGAGPVGLALALQAAHALPQAQISVFDARPVDRDVAADPRTLALSLGSVQLLGWLGVWPQIEPAAQAITEVHVSQQAPSLQALPLGWLADRLGDPTVHIRASEQRVGQLGAVLAYGALLAPMQAAWLARAAAEPGRLHTRFGTVVAGLKPVPGGVEVDAGIVDRHDLVVVAEGGLFADQDRRAIAHDYRQVAWVGTVELPDAPPGMAFERFARQGPVALLPLRGGRAALVWCVDRDDDPVAGLDDAQRLCVLNSLMPPEVGRIAAMSPLKAFPLGLNAERSLTDGRTVRIGNAAQTLHPVAGQGLNLGLRDAHALVRGLVADPDVAAVLRRLEWARAPDRWSVIAATDFLARSFTWSVPGAAVARGLGLAAVQAVGPVKTMLARQMMFGRR